MSPREVTIHYFESGAFVGSRKVVWQDISPATQRYVLPNLAYFCPHCGEIWGRGIYETPHGGGSFWALESRRCPQHGDGYFLVGASPEQLSISSLELLKREALLLALHHKELL